MSVFTRVVLPILLILLLVSCEEVLPGFAWSVSDKDYCPDNDTYIPPDSYEYPDDETDTGTEYPDDSDDYDEDTGETQPDKDNSECKVLEIDPYSFSTWSFGTSLNTYETAVDDTFGSKTSDDILGIHFREPVSVGLYNLYKGDPPYLSSISSDDVFLILEEDYHKSTGESRRKFLNVNGALEVNDYDPVTAEIKGKIYAKLVEADFENVFTSSDIEPTPNGRCLIIDNVVFDTFCQPDCTGKKCGNDGCGGSCGGCGKEKTCNAGQTECVPYECEKLNFGEVTLEKNFYEAFVPDGLAGDASLQDRLRISFYDESGNYRKTLSPAVYDLGSEINSSYPACTECILLYEDMAKDGSSHQKTFFQNKGTLEITETKENSIESRGKASFRLIQVEIDRHYNAVPVDGGNCYEADIEWDTIAAETPGSTETDDADQDKENL